MTQRENRGLQIPQEPPSSQTPSSLWDKKLLFGSGSDNRQLLICAVGTKLESEMEFPSCVAKAWARDPAKPGSAAGQVLALSEPRLSSSEVEPGAQRGGGLCLMPEVQQDAGSGPPALQRSFLGAVCGEKQGDLDL